MPVFILHRFFYRMLVPGAILCLNIQAVKALGLKDTSVGKLISDPKFYVTSACFGMNPFIYHSLRYNNLDFFTKITTNKKILNRFTFYFGSQGNFNKNTGDLMLPYYKLNYSGNWQGLELSGNAYRNESSKFRIHFGFMACIAVFSAREVYYGNSTLTSAFKKHSRYLFTTASVEYQYTRYFRTSIGVRLPLKYSEYFEYDDFKKIPESNLRNEKLYPYFTKDNISIFNVLQFNLEFTIPGKNS